MEPRDLSDHEEYVAGRGIEEVARELGTDPGELITLSSNENPLGPSPAAVAAIREFADEVHQYPKAVHTDLTDAIAEKWGVDPTQVWLAPGGDGALDYLARAMLEPGDAVLVPEPGFAYYGMSARFHHGRVDAYRLAPEDEFELSAPVVLEAADQHRIVYLTSPHNPTGGRFSVSEVEQIARETSRDTLVVVDEAYAEFADGESAVTLLAERDDIAVLRTFSKAYGLAGLRLGYALVPDDWAEAYNRVNTPFATSAVACRAGLAALDDGEHVERTVELARWGREHLREHLRCPTYPSHGNFVLVQVGDAGEVSGKLRERGVIVRDCTSFGLPEHIRVTCGTEAETRSAVEAINEVVEP